MHEGMLYVEVFGVMEDRYVVVAVRGCGSRWC